MEELFFPRLNRSVGLSGRLSLLSKAFASPGLPVDLVATVPPPPFMFKDSWLISFNLCVPSRRPWAAFLAVMPHSLVVSQISLPPFFLFFFLGF